MNRGYADTHVYLTMALRIFEALRAGSSRGYFPSLSMNYNHLQGILVLYKYLLIISVYPNPYLYYL